MGLGVEVNTKNIQTPINPLQPHDPYSAWLELFPFKNCKLGKEGFLEPNPDATLMRRSVGPTCQDAIGEPERLIPAGHRMGLRKSTKVVTVGKLLGPVPFLKLTRRLLGQQGLGIPGKA
jgi:hypothetical protein